MNIYIAIYFYFHANFLLNVYDYKLNILRPFCYFFFEGSLYREQRTNYARLLYFYVKSMQAFVVCFDKALFALN